MRIKRLGIHSVLHFDEFQLDFDKNDAGLHIIYGPNEAGKSTILRVLVDLLFGGKIDDAFKNVYDSKSRIEGILEASRRSGISEIAAGDASMARASSGDAASESRGASSVDGASESRAVATGGGASDRSEVSRDGAATGDSTAFTPLQLAIARKRKYSSLILTDETQAELPDDLVLSLLGGIDKDRYTLLFGFDHDRLRLGGDSLLESGGHAGISLFEAGGGIQFLQKVLGDLSTRTDTLLDTSFRSNSKKNLNAAWRVYKDLKDSARRNSLRGEDWHRLKNEIEVNQELIAALEQELGKLEAKGNQLQRIGRTRPFVVDLKDAKNRLDKMVEADELTPQLDEQIVADVARLEQIDADIAHKAQDLLTEEQKLEAIVVDQPVLDAAVPINSLNRRIEQYLEAAKAVPSLKLQIESEESRARDMAHDLAPELEFTDVQKLFVSTRDDLGIRDLATEWTDLARELKQAGEHVIELNEDIRHREEDLAKLGESPNLRQLRGLLDEASRLGDVESTLSQLQRDIDGKREAAKRQLQTQSIWSGSLEELLQLAVPLPETVSRYAERFSEMEQVIAGHQRDIAKRVEEIENIDEQIATLELSGRVPTEADLAVARAHRDKGWQLVRRSWLGDASDQSTESLEDAVRSYADGKSLPDVFESAMTEADGVSDWMRRESDRSARLSQFQLQRERAENALARLQIKLEETNAQYEDLKRDWAAEWSAAQITPKSSVEMKGWLADYYRPLVKEMQEIQGFATRAEELAVLRDSLKTRLHDALKEARQSATVSTDRSQTASNQTASNRDNEAADFDSLRSLVTACTNFVNEVDGKENLRQTLVGQYNDLRSKRDREAALGKQKKDDFAEIKVRWSKFKVTYPFLPDSPQLAVGYLDKLRELLSVVRDIDRLRETKTNQQAVCTSFEDAARNLSVQVGQSIVDDSSYSLFVEHLASALAEAGKQDSERHLRQQQVTKLTGGLERLKSDKEALEGTVTGYMESYQCADHEGLRMLVSRSIEKKALRSELNQIETSLRHAGDGLSVAELIAEIENGPTVDVLQSATDAVKADHEAKKLERDEEKQALWELQQQFEDMNEDKSDAADAVQQAEFQLAEVDRYWNEYLRFELARRLLQRAIEEFREQNESTVIERAGELFRELTLGHYKELAVEYDGVDPVLEAITSSNERRRVGQMSDGTRDQLYLALRLAFVEQHVDSTDAVPLIMDDILVHFDDARTQATLEVLSRLAQKTQILYFTHHESIVKAASEVAGTGHRVAVHELAGSTM